MAKEIKELQSRKEELDQQANQLADALTVAAQEYAQCQQRLQVCQEALKEAVLKSDVERAELLTRRANQLHRCLSTLHHLQAQLQKLGGSRSGGELLRHAQCSILCGTRTLCHFSRARRVATEASNMFDCLHLYRGHERPESRRGLRKG